ncbi:adenylyl-sulfate kinase [Mycoplasmatota bacterium zrk1]
MNNIKWHSSIVNKTDKEKILKQEGCVIWLTGLSGSGKSTIASEVEKQLTDEGRVVYRLDGDNIRHGLNKDLGFSMEDRKENVRRIAEVAKLFKDAGIITIVSFISPTIELRKIAKDIIGEDFHEVYISASVDDCIQRDPKGLYKKALAGEIKQFTGIDSPYEIPVEPNLIIDTNIESIEESTKILKNYIYKTQLEFITKDLINVALSAGDKILEIYNKEFEVEYKFDDSPLTEADKSANEIIVRYLKSNYRFASILAEESSDDLSRLENDWCFIVDPLDGTKEFVNRNGEFTVNIGLSYKGKSVLGVIYAPIFDEMYYASMDNGSYMIKGDNVIKLDSSSKENELTLVGSKSHRTKELEDLINKNKRKIVNVKSFGSSLKGCMIARNEADLYYRFGLTSEWDTCAMQCVVEEAGAIFRQMDHTQMTYNRKDSLNRKGFYIVNRKENIFI